MCLPPCLLKKFLQAATELLKRGGTQVTMAGLGGGNTWSQISKLFKTVKRSLLSKGGLNVLIQ